ncbi:MAG: RNA polymerase sigma-70 factor (ECF subfamily) [Planctomycetota bacterium]|jgi:RNA polymerase sigma-70 factor (ECF subfamily)
MNPTNIDIDWLLSESDWIRRLARRLLGEGPDADDLAQETWTRALKTKRHGPQSRGWLATIVRNLVSERFRATERRRAREEMAARPESDGAQSLEGAQLRRDLLDLVLSLPEPERTALVLRSIDGLAYEEIASKEGISVVAARKRVSRATERLREKMEASPGGREAWSAALAPFLGKFRGAASLASGTATSGAVHWALRHGLLLMGVGISAAAILVFAWQAGHRSDDLAEATLAGAEPEQVALADEDMPRGNTIPVREVVGAPETEVAGVLEVRIVSRETGKLVPKELMRSAFCQSASDKRIAASETGKDGWDRYRLPPEAGCSLEVVLKNNFATRLEVPPIIAGVVRQVEVAVSTEPDMRFVGRVTDALTTEPISGARIIVEEPSKTDPGQTLVTEYFADADGSYECKAHSWNQGIKLTGLVEKPGYGSVLIPIKYMASGDRIDVKLHAGATLYGLVSAPDVLSNYRVRVTCTSWVELPFNGQTYRLHNVSKEVDVGPDGSWQIQDLPTEIQDQPTNAKLFLTLLDRGEVVQSAPQAVELEPGESHEYNWRVGQNSNIVGQVLLSGSNQPLAHHEVWLRGIDNTNGHSRIPYNREPVARATTDADGAFEFADVLPGEWRLGPAPVRPGFDPAELDDVAAVSQLVVVPPGNADVNVDVVAYRGIFVTGMVRDPSGAPVADGAFVFGWPEDNTGRVGAKTVGGRFRLGPLIPGPHRIGAWAAMHGYAESDRIDVQAGDEDVELQLLTPATIHGILVDAATGAPVRGKVTRSWDGSDMREWGTFRFVGEDGRFTFKALRAGKYKIFAQSAEALSEVVEFTVSSGESVPEFELPMSEGATLVVTYTGTAKGAFYRVEKGSTAVGSTRLRPDQEVRLAVAGGQYTLRFNIPVDGGGLRSFTRDVNLVVGEETPIVIDDED